MDKISCCQYDDFVKCLADDTRQAILELLRDREMNVGEIVACFTLTQPTISHHLALLRRAGLVLARREGRIRYYRANDCCLKRCTLRLVDQFTPQETSRVKSHSNAGSGHSVA